MKVFQLLSAAYRQQSDTKITISINYSCNYFINRNAVLLIYNII